MRWLLLLLGVLANASASVLIKVAVTPPRRLPTLDQPLRALANWPLWLGLVLYGVAFVLYAIVLRYLPLNIAQPLLTAGSVATVAVLALLLFREPFHWTTVAGLGLVIAGVALLTARVP
jgi:multidrug transporter EmrE-like cation transporter